MTSRGMYVPEEYYEAKFRVRPREYAYYEFKGDVRPYPLTPGTTAEEFGSKPSFEGPFGEPFEVMMLEHHSYPWNLSPSDQEKYDTLSETLGRVPGEDVALNGLPAFDPDWEALEVYTLEQVWMRFIDIYGEQSTADVEGESA